MLLFPTSLLANVKKLTAGFVAGYAMLVLFTLPHVFRRTSEMLGAIVLLLVTVLALFGPLDNERVLGRRRNPGGQSLSPRFSADHCSIGQRYLFR